ncbi:MAG TPA: hypothetical protein VMT32_04400 [Bryobacteraceae bacterium]|nr:hypothetical protein [Bryobacteraceae bacterium]
MRKIIGLTLCGLLLLYGLLCVGLYAAMRQPPERFGALMMHVPETMAFLILPFRPFWMVARAGNLNVGDPAPDFELPALDHSHVVTLSAEYRNKPVVLIFGSYT